MTISFNQAAFWKSAAKLSDCPPDVGAEVAFCGRSNAGKSSAINKLTNQSKLARTSKTPGRTQLINFFTLQDDLRLVDLPGFGYARVPTAVKQGWHQQMDIYLRERQSLKALILLMDIRHPLTEFDETMINWSQTANIPLHILLTKADKLKKGPQQNTLLKVRNSLAKPTTLQIFSATKNIGIDVLQKRLTELLVV
jgi:GTP-binding protein